MKKIIFVLSFAFATIVSQAQDITSVFLSMPDDLTLKIDQEQRRVLLESPKDTAKVTAQNMLNENVVREALSDDYIAIKTSDIGMLQIKLLPLINNSYIIGVIRTVCDRACDSQIDFYTTFWKHLPQADLFPAKTKEWFFKADVNRDSQEFKNAYAALSMTPIKLVFSSKNQNVEAVYDIKRYLSEDDYKLIEPFLIKEPKVFTWDKTSYK